MNNAKTLKVNVPDNVFWTSSPLCRFTALVARHTPHPQSTQRPSPREQGNINIIRTVRIKVHMKYDIQNTLKIKDLFDAISPCSTNKTIIACLYVVCMLFIVWIYIYINTYDTREDRNRQGVFLYRPQHGILEPRISRSIFVF